MSTSGLDKTLRTMICEVGGLSPDFPSGADLYQEMGLDSFRMVEIFLAVEKRFGVTISEDDYLGLRTLDQFVALLDKPK